MLAMLKGLFLALLALPQSKKVILAVLGFALSRLIPGLSEEVRLQIVALAGLVIGGQALADHGKEAAKLSPSLAPTVFQPSVANPGRLVAVDAENPINDRR